MKERIKMNGAIVSIDNDVEMSAMSKLVEFSKVGCISEDKENGTLFRLFGVMEDKGDFNLTYDDLEYIEYLRISEFKVLREVGKLKDCNFTLNRDFEVFLSKFTVNEFKFIRGLLRNIEYSGMVGFEDNRKKENEIIYVDGSDLDNIYVDGVNVGSYDDVYGEAS